MSDSYTPTQFVLSSGGGRNSNAEAEQAEYVATRIRIIAGLHPYMAERPDALLALAQSDSDTGTLVNQVTQMYGMETADTFATQLQGMDPTQQRAVWAKLPRIQQMGLAQMGYQPEERDDPSRFGQALGVVGDVVGGVLGAGASVVGPVVSPVLEKLAWVGNQPGHLYRSIRLMDDEQQWLGLAGAVLGTAAAVAFAPVTGGGSLAALGWLGGGALLGATAGAAVTAPGDWKRAFNESWNGERTFDRAARSRADELLGDPRLVGLAQDLAELDDFSIDDLAVELAALKDGSGEQVQYAKLNELALQMGQLGSAEHQQAFTAMLNILAVPEFQQAVEALQNGKMSPGRDAMDALGIDNESGIYKLGSGAIDLAFTLGVDPLLMASGIRGAVKAQRLGVEVREGADLATALYAKFEIPSVRRLHEEVVKAFNGVDGVVDVRRLRSIGPEFERIIPEVQQYRAALNAMSGKGRGPLTVEEFQTFLAGQGHLSPVLRGVGTVRGAGRIVLKDWSPMRQAYREFAHDVRGFVHGLADPAMEEAYIRRALKSGQENPSMLDVLPDGMADEITTHGLMDNPWRYSDDQKSYRFGRSIGSHMPFGASIGKLIDTMTTMAPAGRSIALTGENAARDVTAMTEMGTYLGMPSWVRSAWKDAILTSASGAERQLLAIGWLDNALTLAGGRSSAKLEELTDQFIKQSKQIYGFNDTIQMGNKVRHVGLFSSQTADEIVMPSLKQLRKYAMSGNIAKMVGLGDLELFEGAMNKVWKPAVLLRMAFIPRAVGEEMLAFFLRGGIGGLGQDFAARSVGERRIYDEAVALKAAGRQAEMTPGHLGALMRGRDASLPANVRWIQRVMNHTGWADPSFRVLDRYGTMLRGALEKGIGVRNTLDLAEKTGRSKFAINAADKADAILLGNQYSWRRMFFGGVDSGAVDAAVAWGKVHQTSMMRSLATAQTGPLAEVRDPASAVTRAVSDGKGGYKYETVTVIHHEREMARIGDEAYDGHIQRMLTEPLEDPKVQAAMMRHVSLVRGDVKVSDAELLDILEPLRSLPAGPRAVVNEYLADPNRETFDAMIDWLGARHPEVAEVLKLLPTSKMPTYDDVLTALRQFRNGIERPWEHALPATGIDPVDMADVVEPAWFRESLDQLHLSPAERVQQQLDAAEGRLGDEFWTQNTDPLPEDFDYADPMAYRRRNPYSDDQLAGWQDEYGELIAEGPLDTSGMVPGPRRMALLQAELDDAVKYENEVAKIKFGPDEDELKTFRTEQIDRVVNDQKLIEDALSRHGGRAVSVDSRTGLPVFHIKPTSAGEWAWWRSLQPNERRSLGMRYLRGSQTALPIDTIAAEAGMTVSEWGDEFLKLIRQHAAARAEASAARKLSKRAWREQYSTQRMAELDRFAPNRTPDEIRGELDQVGMLATRMQEDADRLLPPQTFPNGTWRERDDERLAAIVNDPSARPTPDGYGDVEPPVPQSYRDRYEAERLAMADSRPDALIPPEDALLNLPESTTYVPAPDYVVDIDPATIDDFFFLLERAAPSVRRIEKMGDAERGFVGQLARGMDRPQSGFRLRDLRDAVHGDGPSPFYDRWDESVHRELVDTLTNEAMNPYYHEGTETLMRSGGEDTGLVGSVIHLYEAPSFRGAKKLASYAGSPLTYDQILNAAVDRRLIEDNAEVVKQILAGGGDNAFMVADVRLARELKQIDAKLKNGGRISAAEVRQINLPRDFLDGRVHDGTVVPLVKRSQNSQIATADKVNLKGETQLWQVEQSFARARTERIPATREQKAREWAQDTADNLRMTYTRETQSWRQARTRLDKDGNQVSVVYRRGADGELRPVDPTERLTREEAFLDKNGKPIDPKNISMFELGGEATPGGTVPWEVTGNIFQDTWDTRLGAQRLAPKQQMSMGSGRVIPSEEKVRVFRSRREQMARLGDARPTVVWGTPMASTQKESGWDKLVRLGFDKVIGGSIDAIARRPMAFHYFKQRYTENMKLIEWTMDPVLAEKAVAAIEHTNVARGLDAKGQERMAEAGRRLAHLDGDENALAWSTNEALAWLRSHDVETLRQRLVAAKSAIPRALDPTIDNAVASEAEWLLSKHPSDVLTMPGAKMTPREVVKYVESQLPAGALDNPLFMASPQAQRLLAQHPSLQHLRPGDWEDITALRNNLKHISDSASDAASVGAISDMMPFIDSHEFKTQFAEFGKGFLPFWYAEENFMKRWVRGLADQGPAMIRRAQLGYMGLKNAGVIRTDENGKDWFVYPGSTLLADALDKINPTLGLAAKGIMFQTPTDALLPGVNDRFGVPAFNPLVTVPVDLATALFPELAPVNQALAGNFGNRNAIEQLIPSHVINIFKAATGDASSNQRYMSAMTAAIAQLEATGNGLPEDATPGQRDDYLRRIRNHARIIVTAQAVAGFFTPGPPTAINAGDTASLTGIGVKNPAEIFSKMYVELVRGLGIEQGTIKFLELHPDATIDDMVVPVNGLADPDLAGVVNPLAYTESRTESLSGAQLGTTNEALRWYEQNSDYLDAMPNAGPWLLPQDYLDGPRAEYAYDSQTVSGLQRRKSPEEFLNNLKFKEASGEYFETKAAFDNEIAIAQEADNADRVRDLKLKKQTWGQVYLAAHPVFAEELVNGEGKARRAAVLSELRIAVDDYQVPQSARTDELTKAIKLFDAYKTMLAELSNDGSAEGRVKVEQLKVRYGNAMDQIVRQNPTLRSFWVSILRPEASLD